jgi:D-3-phosphoglycerate dehydrogenase
VLAEHALALLLAAAKGLPQAARASSWHEHRPRRLAGSTVGLVGAGAIGRSLASLLAPLRLTILAVNRSGAPVAGAAETVGPGGLHDVLGRCDYAVLSAPLTQSTRRLIGAPELELLGPNGWLVNVGRGAVVDTDALVAALESGRLAGACLDVTDPEPLPDGHPLWSLPNVLMTPHAANPPGTHLPALAERVEENVRRFGNGLPLLGVIDVEHGY